MWKNKSNKLSVSNLYTTYQIKGLNLDRFINSAKKRGINLYQIKKQAKNALTVSVKFDDRQKFFAFAKELCYNIKKVRDNGVAYPLLLLYRSIGLVIGAVLILITCIIFDNLIFSFSFTGSGSIYKREVAEYLNERGIKEFSTFSSISLEQLEDDILSKNSHLSFVSCQKRGNRLQIELVLSKDKVDRLDGSYYELYSSDNGVIEDIKVYRGNALVEKGQSVKMKDLLVDGNLLINDNPVRVNILAYVSIITSYTYEYRSLNSNESDIALVLAEQYYNGLSIVDTAVSENIINGEYIYLVNLSVRKVLFVG